MSASLADATGSVQQIDARFVNQGTKFRLFLQPNVLETYRDPVTVWVSPPPGSIGPGPSDEVMRVIDAIGKKPYEDAFQPPYRGSRNPEVQPDVSGHFDHLKVGSRAFQAAHMYGCLRHVLDVWEGYFSEPVRWFFADRLPFLELLPVVDWDNGQAGEGFIETGHEINEHGEMHPFCLNFDVLAHEMGHILIYSKVGIPDDALITAEYRGFQESASDLVALVASLHFDLVMDRLLEGTRGNLYALNELNRIAETSETRQIRIASNDHRMSDVISTSTPAWNLTQHEIHELGEPLTGAIFDIFVEVFQRNLIERGLIDERLDRLSGRITGRSGDLDAVQAGFDRAYVGRHEAFKGALVDARDYLGERLAKTWEQLSPHHLTFRRVGCTLLTVDRLRSGWKYQDTIIDCLRWRGIGGG